MAFAKFLDRSSSFRWLGQRLASGYNDAIHEFDGSAND